MSLTPRIPSTPQHSQSLAEDYVTSHKGLPLITHEQMEKLYRSLVIRMQNDHFEGYVRLNNGEIFYQDFYICFVPGKKSNQIFQVEIHVVTDPKYSLNLSDMSPQSPDEVRAHNITIIDRLRKGPIEDANQNNGAAIIVGATKVQILKLLEVASQSRTASLTERMNAVEQMTQQMGTTFQSLE